MRRLLFTLFVLAAAAFAGCVDPPEDLAENEQEPIVDADGRLHTPEWALGDHWTYESPTGTFTLVVGGDEGQHWVMDTTSADLAYFEAQNDASYLGEIRKTDLAGNQGGDRVVYFQFPLEDGKEWTTRWDGLDLRVTATATGDGTFQLVGMDGTRKHVEYVYDADVRFFKEATWFGENGEEEWQMRLTGDGANYSGTLVRYAIGATVTLVAGADGTNIQTVPIEAQWNEIGLRAVLLCLDDPAGRIHVGVNSPDAEDSPVPMLPTVNEPEAGAGVDCSEAQVLDEAWLMTNSGGDWDVGLLVGAPNGLAHLFMEERARAEIAFP